VENDRKTVDDDDSDAAPGWDAIDASLAPLYQDQKPVHMGTVLNYQFGGPDPLDGMSAYRRELPVPHWHFVTYGFSELYQKESDDPECSGYGFELTFRLLADAGETAPPSWVFSFLQNLARYVFKSGNVFSPGDWMTANGPIALGTDTAICAMGFVSDPELPPVQTPHGSLTFVQVVGLTVEEERAAKQWQTSHLLDVLLPHMPLWITDLHRASLLDAGTVAAQVEEGKRRDGSSSGALYTDVLAVRESKRLLRAPLLEIDIGARQVQELAALLPLRIPFGRSFLVAGREWKLRFEAGDACLARVDGNVVTVTLDSATAGGFEHAIPARAGQYRLPALPGLGWHVQATLIKDGDGNVVARIG